MALYLRGKDLLHVMILGKLTFNVIDNGIGIDVFKELTWYIVEVS